MAAGTHPTEPYQRLPAWCQTSNGHELSPDRNDDYILGHEVDPVRQLFVQPALAPTRSDAPRVAVTHLERRGVPVHVGQDGHGRSICEQTSAQSA